MANCHSRKTQQFLLVLVMVTVLLFGYGIINAQDRDRVVVVPFVDSPKGDALITDVLNGKTFSNSFGIGLTGTRSPAPVPRTGQTLCYSDFDPGVENNQIPCKGTGQDGDLQKGVVWPSPRFTDNLNGTVTDNLTRLVWLKNANCMAGKKTRTEALEFANALYDHPIAPFPSDDCGLSDGSKAGTWRLPNLFELISLLDISQEGPPLPVGHPFQNVQTDDYWTSSYSAYYADLGVGWIVQFRSGMTNLKSWTVDPCYVWLVRDGR